MEVLGREDTKKEDRRPAEQWLVKKKSVLCEVNRFTFMIRFTAG